MDYEKLYNEAIERAKKHCADYVVETIFPELAESEDEKIRQRLLFNFEALGKEEWGGLKVRDICAWLYEQGEQESNYCHHEVDLSGCSEEYCKAYYDGWNNCNQQHAQLAAEQKPADKVEPKFKAGDRVIGTVSGMQYYITEVCDDYYYTESGCTIMFYAQDNFELYKQKPVWSEEDEARFESCIKVLQTSDGYDTINVKWLKSLKDRVLPQPKQEYDDMAYEMSRAVLYDKLKDSLKPQSNWKPSDAQMASITCAVRKMKESACYDSELVSLLNDLKKL